MTKRSERRRAEATQNRLIWGDPEPRKAKRHERRMGMTEVEQAWYMGYGNRRGRNPFPAGYRHDAFERARNADAVFNAPY